MLTDLPDVLGEEIWKDGGGELVGIVTKGFELPLRRRAIEVEETCSEAGGAVSTSFNKRDRFLLIHSRRLIGN